MFNNKTILITGGTGSFGQECTKFLLSNYKLKKLIIYSRDENKQYHMRRKIQDSRLNTRAFGEDKPNYPSIPLSERKKNRRVLLSINMDL